jgi:hypothetical protein|tara:strand:+ start:3113 stop:3352 length:240 start_codon:yes stop_codon:yes gene_type:complete
MALTKTDELKIERIARKEMRSFLNNTQLQNMVINTVRKEIKDKRNEKRIVELCSKVIVELYKTLWMRRSMWDTQIKRVS